ncbi:MAG TPA: hypothetical protein VFE05_23300 [Longimicrobiaceae bacterium]|jgi:hypothetical protein|nr:hypothetical protein [Longimicrobiaceae bacterium]
MSPPARFILAVLPPLPAGLLRALAAADPRVELVGGAADLDDARALLRAERPDAVLLGARDDALPPGVPALLEEFPRLTVVVFGPGGRRAAIAALRLHVERLDDPAPGELLDAVRAAAVARAWFPLAEEDASPSGPGGQAEGGGGGLDPSPSGPDRAVHSAAAGAGGTSPPGTQPAPGATAIRVLLSPALLAAPMPPTAATLAFDQAVHDMLRELKEKVLQDPPPTPQSSVAAVSARERSVGVGNRKGVDVRDGFVPGEVFGGRVEALVRFELWTNAPAGLAPLTTGVQERLRTRRDELRQLGFLRLSLADTTPAEPVGADWRQSVLAEVLYEYEYRDADDSESLIVAIPVDVEEPPDAMRITGRLARWDQLRAPPLAVRGPAAVQGIGVLAFVPAAAPAGGVTVTRTFDGAAGAPGPFTDPAAFRASVTGPVPATRHARLAFATLQDFLDAADPAGAALVMGDWDEDSSPDSYDARLLDMGPGIRLASAADRLEVAFAAAALDQTAVLYLRPLPDPPA